MSNVSITSSLPALMLSQFLYLRSFDSYNLHLIWTISFCKQSHTHRSARDEKNFTSKFLSKAVKSSKLFWRFLILRWRMENLWYVISLCTLHTLCILYMITLYTLFIKFVFDVPITTMIVSKCSMGIEVWIFWTHKSGLAWVARSMLALTSV